MCSIIWWDQKTSSICDLDPIALAHAQHFERSIENACALSDLMVGPFFSSEFFD